MRARNAKVTAVLLACFLGMTAIGCSEDKNSSSDKDSSTAGISAEAPAGRDG